MVDEELLEINMLLVSVIELASDIPLNELVDEYRNGVKTGLRVGRDVADDDHPQNFLGRVRIFDPQSLSSARPDRSLAESRSLFGFDPVWNPAQYLITSVVGYSRDR